MNVGDRVRFRAPMPDEVEDRFVILELRGERVLVRAADSHFSIVPTFVYTIAELELDA